MPEELKDFCAELHVHTVLSACAEIEMIPPLIVEEALARSIDVIAVTDHNASANIAAVQRAAAGTALTVLPGMELQTREEVHVLCIFDTIQQIETFQSFVNQHLPNLENRADFFGEQLVVDENGDFIRRETRLLAVSADVSLREAWEQVDRLGGLFIPAHVNRRANGLLFNLGFVPTDVPIEALEISMHLSPTEAVEKYPTIRGFPLLQSGDVHRLDDFLGATRLRIQQPTTAEIRQALRSEHGRRMWIEPAGRNVL